MRPSTLKPGTWLVIKHSLGGGEYRAQFVRRIPAQGKGRPAASLILNPEWAGLNGADDPGLCRISDYDLARYGRLCVDRHRSFSEVFYA
ncbi:hypothetical protein D3C78_416980 [compost metagenome]